MRFNGKHEKLDNFLFSMQQYLESVNLTGQDACRFIVLYLTDDAMTWWRQYCATQGGLSQVFSNIMEQDLYDELEAQFTDVDKQNRIREKLFALL